MMVNAAGRAKILDFGLAKMYRGGTEEYLRAGMLIGTSHAMSPEQAQGLAIDHRSDLFSLGSLLYEMITGVSPFAAATAAETLGRICAYEPRPILDIDPGVPRELAELTHQLLNKSPAHRPHNSSDVAAALERIEHSGSLHAAVRGGLAAPGNAERYDAQRTYHSADTSGEPAHADRQRAAANHRPLLRRSPRHQLGSRALPGVRSRDPLRVDVPASAARADGCAAS